MDSEQSTPRKHPFGSFKLKLPKFLRRSRSSLVPARSKMGVYKKIKRVFSFKKDKDQKRDKKDGKNGAGDTLTANGSLGRDSSDVDIVKTDTLRKDNKKRSLSFTSILRKSSFGKKDKDGKKRGKEALAHSSNDMRPEPALLSNVIAPPAASTEQVSASTSQVAAVVEPTTAPPPLPANSPPSADAREEQASTERAVDVSDRPVEDDSKTEDFVVITSDEVEEIKAYEAKLAGDGVAVCATEVAPAHATEGADDLQPAKVAEVEPHTIIDVINLLSEKPDPTAHAEGSADTTDAKADNATIVCPKKDAGARESAPAAVASPETCPVLTSNGSANGHIKREVSATSVTAKPVLLPMSKTAGQSKEVKLWRGWVATALLIVSLVVAILFGTRCSTIPGAVRAD